MEVIKSIIELQTDPDLLEVSKFADELYQKHFGEFFHNEKALFVKMQDVDRQITDAELEEILTTLPLELFTVSERLANFKLMLNVVKLKMKEHESKYMGRLVNTDMKEAEKRDIVNYNIMPDKLLINVYEAISIRVDKEMSFSRELIMSAKKIWDARKRTENSNPISEHNSDDEDSLPEYKPAKKYIQ